MKKRPSFILALSLCFAFYSQSAYSQFQPESSASASGCSGLQIGVNGDLKGFRPFPANHPWNRNIAGERADPESSEKLRRYLDRIGWDPYVRGDFSPVYGQTYNIVDSDRLPLRPIQIDDYPGESDIVPVPLPDSSEVSVGSVTCPDGGDCHLMVIDRKHCWLYETWQTKHNGNDWHASNMAVWDLLSPNSRPLGWTAADAAGLPVLPGLVRYDEVASGAIRHAIRFTLSKTGNSFVAPATHSAGYDTQAFPMGTRFRLRADFDISGFSQVNQVILRAMKEYGLILADNGNDLEVAGAKDSRWRDEDVVALRAVHLSNFEVMPSSAVMSRSDLPSGPLPEIQQFKASTLRVHAGQAVELHWSASPGSWFLVSSVGPVRGTSVMVRPSTTTTYELQATNGYGRARAWLTVEVE
jgi:hypothetical protein